MNYEVEVKVPVTWTCTPEYDGWTAGSYTFTAALATDAYSFTGPFPSVTVTVKGQTGAVAQIGSITYDTLDAAVKDAADGDTIELLANCTTVGMNLEKNLTIESSGEQRFTVNYVQDGIALWGKSLTFRNCDVIMNGVGATPYNEWSWMTICASVDATLSLDNVNMTMDATGASGSPHAIYFCKNNVLDLRNGTVLTIKNYPNDALEWDGGNGGYNVNITNSTFISDHNRSGFTGTFYATIDGGTVEVTNSSGNGSNGTYFTIKNGSNVLFDGNRNWGISAWRIDMTGNSTLTATNNGYSGIWTRVLNVDGTCTLDVEYNGRQATGFTTNAGIFYQGNGTYTSEIEPGANVTIKNNAGSGIYTNQGVCNITIHSAVITNNGTGTINSTDGKGATYGGGVYNIGTMILGEDVVIYNNHADTAGDDIYNAPTDETKTITFGKVGSGWVLDGEPDCADPIDGWYDDSEGARWEAHSKPLHAVEFDRFESSGMVTWQGALALKAAHGLIPLDPGDPELPKWAISKSKTATPLDEDLKSQVTLSLPSAEARLASDVVFVLDKSTSADVESQMGDMLTALCEQVEATGAKINVGVVIFNKVANKVLPLTELNESNMGDIKDAIATEIQSGTNTHAGLLAGKAMLDEDASVDADRKYLIFVSDGITYMYNEVPTVTAWTFLSDSWLNWAGPDNWKSKYGTTDAPTDWAAWMSDIGSKVAAQGTTYEYPYEGTVGTATPVANWNTAYANSIDKALYETYTTYQTAAAQGYHCYAMKASTNADHPWASSFMEYLAGGNEVSFSDIQNDILYAVDEGSYVVDYIGYVAGSYDFDFVNDVSAMSLKVGEETYSAVKLADNRYGFKPVGDAYAFTLEYERGNGLNEEHFTWHIGEAVSNFAPVQLTYTVKLVTPPTEPGDYELDTNQSATLYPMDSNGEQGVPENFEKPKVDYTVGGGTGPEGPGTDPTPPGGTDPTPPGGDDGTDIPDGDTPTTDLPDQETPTTELPEEETPTTELPEEETPLAEVPETGDMSALWLAMTALSGTGLAGVTFLGRKKRDEE